MCSQATWAKMFPDSKNNPHTKPINPMSIKTYIVEIDNTLFTVEATSIDKAAAQILEVEKPIREFIRWNRCFSSIKYRDQFQNGVKVNPARKCTVHLSFDELVSYDLPFFTYDFCQA